MKNLILIVALKSYALIGGWYPIIFKTFDSDKITTLNSKISDGSLHNINIKYDANSQLVKQIINGLDLDSDVHIQIQRTKLVDTDTVKYNHQQVTVILFQ